MNTSILHTSYGNKAVRIMVAGSKLIHRETYRMSLHKGPPSSTMDMSYYHTAMFACSGKRIWPSANTTCSHSCTLFGMSLSMSRHRATLFHMTNSACNMSQVPVNTKVRSAIWTDGKLQPRWYKSITGFSVPSNLCDSTFITMLGRVLSLPRFQYVPQVVIISTSEPWQQNYLLSYHWNESVQVRLKNDAIKVQKSSKHAEPNPLSSGVSITAKLVALS